ncbi:type II CAAX endopeptidase family protein [Peribacillus kribbensis]|uniref:type II CAAX endopeptidase family protein n=1 Tax=Peribacillus kribbensis TaxID=356658 RepID=UPI0003F6CFB7|nr:type II CAAX endopeptidase family protein [Peribacillus kribbensis]
MKNKQAEIIKTLSDRQLLFHLMLTQFLLLFLSGVLGFFLFSGWNDFKALFRISDSNIWTIGIPAGLLTVLLDSMLTKILPEKYQDDGGINERIFKSLSYPMLLVVPAVVAVCEEVLFRGVLQSNLGLITASLIFALVHYRYLFNWYLFVNMVILSFFMGYLFYWTENLWVCMAVHFIIDFLLGLSIKFKHS